MSHKRLACTACLYCRCAFRPSHHWQAFCGDSCRRAASFLERQTEYACTYCGVVSDTIDHIPPTSVRPFLIESGLAARIPFLEVRACRECNSGLGAKPLWTVTQRRQWVHKWLARRYRRFFAIPDWSDRELESVSDRLRDHILHGLAARDFLKRRIHYGG